MSVNNPLFPLDPNPPPSPTSPLFRYSSPVSGGSTNSTYDSTADLVVNDSSPFDDVDARSTDGGGSGSGSGSGGFVDMDWMSAPGGGDTFGLILNGIIVPYVFGAVTVVGIVGNSLVIYVIVTRERMRTITNILLLNLAVADLTFVGLVPPVTAYQFATSSWPFGDVACRLMHYLVNVTAYVTVYTLVLVSVIRYMTIVHATKTVRFRSRRNVIASIAVLWLSLMAVNTPILTAYGLQTYDLPGGGHVVECVPLGLEQARCIFVTFFACAYALPLGVIAAISVSIMRHIARHRMTPGEQRVTRTAHKKKRAGRLLMLVVIVFAVLWLPIHIHLLVGFFTEPTTDQRWRMAMEVLRVVWHCLMYANSCVNPFIYNHASKDFRDGFRDVVKRRPCRSSADHHHHHASLPGGTGAYRSAAGTGGRSGADDGSRRGAGAGDESEDDRSRLDRRGDWRQTSLTPFTNMTAAGGVDQIALEVVM